MTTVAHTDRLPIGTSPYDDIDTPKFDWSLKEIAEVDQLKKQGFNYRQIAVKFNEKYGTRLTKNAVGKRHWRWKTTGQL